MTKKMFEKLRRNDKAVLVARDIIEQLEINKYQANVGIYVDFEISDSWVLEEEQDLTHLVDMAEYCEVCMLGALAISANKFYSNIRINAENSLIKNHRIVELLLSIFSREQLRLLEISYEQNDEGDYLIPKGIFTPELEEKVSGKHNIFCEMEPRERMIEICNNIIDNKGGIDIQRLIKMNK